MKSIICVGNRYDPRDAAGPHVYDRLAAGGHAPDVELVDGGLCGLDLLRFVDGAERVVFVDSVSGFGKPGEVMILNAADVAASADGAFDHGSGLPYLLRVAPLVCEKTPAEIIVVGLEGAPDSSALDVAARMAAALAEGERPAHA
jgi:hydrogenase maturation protease